MGLFYPIAKWVYWHNIQNVHLFTINKSSTIQFKYLYYDFSWLCFSALRLTILNLPIIQQQLGLKFIREK